jgi:hypothetical protein
MSLREKILVGFVALALLFGATVMMRKSSRSGDVVMDSAEFQARVLQMADVLDQASLTPVERAVLDRARLPWRRDPFANERLSPGRTADEPRIQDRPDFQYTAYMKMGPREIAVIDQVEYTEGDHLRNEPFTVRKIEPRRVTLVGRTPDDVVVVDLVAEEIF